PFSRVCPHVCQTVIVLHRPSHYLEVADPSSKRISCRFEHKEGRRAARNDSFHHLLFLLLGQARRRVERGREDLGDEAQKEVRSGILKRRGTQYREDSPVTDLFLRTADDV